MTLTRGFIRNAATTPLDARLADMGLVVCNADGSPRAGVLTPLDGLVTALATMHVAVAAAEFVTSKGKADGVARLTNDGVVNVAISAAPVSNSRIDVIWVKHNDDTTGDANALPTFGVTAGVAAAVPTKPAIPTGALELATLRVYAGTTAANGGANVLTNTYAFTAPRGSTVLMRTNVERAAWTNPSVGQEVLVLAGLERWQWTGAAWALLLRPFQSWNPSPSGLTVGNGQLDAWYLKQGRLITLVIEFASGSTSAATGPISLNLPEAAANPTYTRHIGTGLISLASGAAFPIQGRMAGGAGTTITLITLDSSVATLAPNVNVSNASPTSGAWGNVSFLPKFTLEATYLAAA